MGGCVTWLLILAGAVLGLVTMLRWFEQATEAAENGWWNKVMMLVLIPPSVWFYPSRISAGRPSAVPHHEPVRGFGTVPLNPKVADAGPPPGTPKEFIGLPTIPPKRAKSAVDPDKIAKLKQKMREQGMMGDEQ